MKAVCASVFLPPCFDTRRTNADSAWNRQWLFSQRGGIGKGPYSNVRRHQQRQWQQHQNAKNAMMEHRKRKSFSTRTILRLRFYSHFAIRSPECYSADRSSVTIWAITAWRRGKSTIRSKVSGKMNVFFFIERLHGYSTYAANIINALSLLLLCAELLIREYRFVCCNTISSYGARDTGCTRKCMRQESSSIIEIFFEQHVQMTNLYGATRRHSRTPSISLAMCPTSTSEVVTQGYS